MALRKVSDIFPITYGHQAPEGFGGKPDEVQMRFNRVIHHAQHPHDATYAEFDAGIVIAALPDPHWLAFCEVDAKLTDEETLRMLAQEKVILDAIGRAIGQENFGRKDYSARIELRNEQVFEEWLIDYAERQGMFVESARNDVLEARKAATRSANAVPGASSYEWRKVPELEELDLSGIKVCDPVYHDKRLSHEWTRERIERDKQARKLAAEHSTGLTIKDLNDLSLSYSQIKATETFRADETGEVSVVVTKTGKLVRKTGKFVERLIPKAKPTKKAPTAAQIGAFALSVVPMQMFLAF